MKCIILVLSILLCCLTAWAKRDNTIVVKNADEFIAALGPDRTIVIDSRTPLMLTPALEEFVSENIVNEYEYYEYIRPENAPGISFYDNFDGMALAVTGFDNLTIKAKGDRKVTLLVSPRYANVLLFEDCNNLTLENLVMGHTETGTCEAGVLELRRCKDVKVKGCDLFGCGTEAIIIGRCQYVDVVDTEMHHCSYHSLHVLDSSHIRFKDCNIHDNKEFEQINVHGSRDVWFDGCNFVNLQGDLFDVRCPTDFYDCFFEGCYVNDITYINEHGPRESTGEVWKDWIEVTGTDVNLRNGPSTDYSRQSIKLKKGEYAQKLDETDEWVKIYLPESPFGYAWIFKKYAMDVPVDAIPLMVRDCVPVVSDNAEFVDLGLSVDWAVANFGAVDLDFEQYGDFMSWPVAMDYEYPSGGRLPTAAEWEELLTLPYKMVQLPSEIRVVVFTAPNGNTITIPTNGYADEDGNQEFGFFGYYWTSSRTDGDEYTYPLGFVVKVPDQMCQVEKLIDQLCVGVRLVLDKAN